MLDVVDNQGVKFGDEADESRAEARLSLAWLRGVA